MPEETYGVRATRRAAIGRMLDHHEWRNFSDAEIARRCVVSAPLVRKVRAMSQAVDANEAEDRAHA